METRFGQSCYQEKSFKVLDKYSSGITRNEIDVLLHRVKQLRYFASRVNQKQGFSNHCFPVELGQRLSSWKDWKRKKRLERLLIDDDDDPKEQSDYDVVPCDDGSYNGVKSV